MLINRNFEENANIKKLDTLFIFKSLTAQVLPKEDL